MWVACENGSRDPTKKSPSTKSAESALGLGFSDGGMRKPRVYNSIFFWISMRSLIFFCENPEHRTSNFASQGDSCSCSCPPTSLPLDRANAETIRSSDVCEKFQTLPEQAFSRILVLARIPTRAWRSLRSRSRERGSPRKTEGCGSPCRAEDPQMWIPSLENT